MKDYSLHPPPCPDVQAERHRPSNFLVVAYTILEEANIISHMTGGAISLNPMVSNNV